MFHRERQTGQPNNEFKVVPAGADIAHKWLKTMDMAAEMPVQVLKDEEPELSLGDLDIHNTLVHLIAPRLVYIPGGSYEVRTGIITTPQQRSSGGLDLPSFGRTRHSSPFGSIIELAGNPEELANLLSGGRGSDVPVALPTLADTLRRRPNLVGYGVEYRVDQQEIRINPPEHQPGEVQDNAYLIQTKQIPMMGGVYYLENLKAEIDADPKAFETKYRFYGRLIEDIVGSIYQANRTQSPDATLNFAPPDDTATKVRRMERLLTVGRRQMSAAGLLEDGDDEDIEKRIIMERPNIRFSDVGGQEKAKTELSDVVAGLADPQEFFAEGAEPPNGVLLYGPSGTGKTLLARATAGEANATIYSVGLASILHSLWGKTERYIQRIFDKAQEQAPSIIFFDEIDAIARQRSSLNHAYSSIVNVLLTNMDGMQERAQNVVVIGATNLLELVDDALLRPGRFDLLVPVELPDDAARAQVFEIHKQKALARATRPVDEIFDTNFDMTKLVGSTKGFSGADIAEILRRSLVERVRLRRRGAELHPLTAQDFVDQIALYEQVRKDKASRVNRTIGFQVPTKQ